MKLKNSLRNRWITPLVCLGVLTASLAVAENVTHTKKPKGPTPITYYTDSDCRYTFEVYGYDVNEESHSSCESYPHLGTIEPGGRLTIKVRDGETFWVRFSHSGPCDTDAPSMDTSIPGGQNKTISYELSCGFSS